eukprot:1891710-Amphidinium_carterae.1
MGRVCGHASCGRLGQFEQSAFSMAHMSVPSLSLLWAYGNEIQAVSKNLKRLTRLIFLHAHTIFVLATIARLS